MTLLMPMVEPSCGGFIDQRQTQFIGQIAQYVASPDYRKLRSRQIVGQPDSLGEHLVHRNRRGHHAAAGVWDAEHLEGALNGAVFAEVGPCKEIIATSKPSSLELPRDPVPMDQTDAR